MQHHAFSPPAPLQQPQPQQAAQQQFGLSHMQQQRISPQAAAQLQYQQQFPHTAPMNNQSPSNMQDQLAGFGNIPPTRLGSISGLGPGFAGITPSPHMSQGSPHTPMSVPAHLMTPGALGGMPPQGLEALRAQFPCALLYEHNVGIFLGHSGLLSYSMQSHSILLSWTPLRRIAPVASSGGRDNLLGGH